MKWYNKLWKYPLAILMVMFVLLTFWTLDVNMYFYKKISKWSENE